MITSSILLRGHPSHHRSDYLHEVLLEPTPEVALAMADFQSLAALSEHLLEAVAFQAPLEEGVY